MSLLKYITNRKDKIYLTPQGHLPIPLKQVARAGEAGDAVPYEQALKYDNDGVTQSNLFTTFSGAITFSNVLGLISNLITERTAGAGTAIKNPAVIVTGATLAPTAATSSTHYVLSKADGITVTLPAAATAMIGAKYKFTIATTVTSVGYIINTTGSDVFVGGIHGVISVINATNDAIFGTSTANKTITLNGTTTGGLIGGWIEVVCISATQWAVSGVTLGTGIQATAFSN